MSYPLSVEIDQKPELSQRGAIGNIVRLLNPATVLIARLDSAGAAVLYKYTLQNSAYTRVGNTVVVPTNPTAYLTFGVDGPPYPYALVVERTNDWVLSWDDEIAHVIGGSAFPLGASPIPIQGVTKPVLPQNKLEVVYTAPQGGAPAQFVITGAGSTAAGGFSRTQTSVIEDLAQGQPAARTLSLWLADGDKGYIAYGAAANPATKFA